MTAIAHPDDLLQGTEVCQSGTSRGTIDAGGYLCGTITNDCLRAATNCTLTNPEGVVNIGDSGGTVWMRTATGIMLAGWITAGYGTPAAHGYSGALFAPTWALQDHPWTATQAWTPGAENIPPSPPANASSPPADANASTEREVHRHPAGC